MSSLYSYPPHEVLLSQLARIKATMKELEKEKGEIERGLKGERESFLISDVLYNIIRDFHSKKNGVHVVPQRYVDMVKSMFEYTNATSYNKPKTEEFMETNALSICKKYSSELRLSELAFLNFNGSRQHTISTVIHIDGTWKMFFHIFGGEKSEYEIFSKGSWFSHDLSKFELKSHDVCRDRSYKKTYKSVSFILIFDYDKSTNITTFKAIPIKSSTPVLPGISVGVVGTQQFRGGGGSRGGSSGGR